MNRFEKIKTPIKDLFVIKNSRIGDDRGYISRLFCADIFENYGWFMPLIQVNFTKTFKKGTVRGFHFQHYPFEEFKLVRCLSGQVYDVALDLRQGSDTFLQTNAQILTSENNTNFLIPPGVAHGFQSLTDNAQLLYFHSKQYSPDHEGGVNPLDPRIGFSWPENISKISKKDSERKYLSDSFKGVRFELSSL
jgi:dTDP-4-dehydrorhamnose 3,5-epimerase